jgi:hypothetical protein
MGSGICVYSGIRGAHMAEPKAAFDLRTFPHVEHSRPTNSVTNGKNSMPPWGGLLKQEEIEELWAYVVAGEKANANNPNPGRPAGGCVEMVEDTARKRTCELSECLGTSLFLNPKIRISTAPARSPCLARIDPQPLRIWISQAGIDSAI